MLWSSIGSLRLAAATALLATTPAFAQSTGQVTGVVKDSTGAVLAGATVTVTGADGAKHEASTSPDGSYTVSGLPPGNYSVSAAHVGFRTALQQRQAVAGGGTLTVDFTLETNLKELTEEITVTAMKREDVVRKVPFSLTAMTEETLRVRGATDIEDVAANVGGLSVQNLGPGQSQVAIRGLSSGQIARDQPGVKEQAGIYLDESVISMSLFTPDIDLFDMSRVEVLRGPQGTLFGSGSESGTVRYITNQPKLGTTQWFGELDGSTIQHGNQAGNVKFGFNVPLGEIAALRASAYYNALGGYIDSPGIKTTANGSIQPDPTTAQNHVNTGKRFGGRIAVKLVPIAGLTITPRFLYQKIQMDGWNRIDDYNILANSFTTNRPAVTLGNLDQFIQIPEPYTDKWYLADLNINYVFGEVELTSISSYNRRDILVVRDAGALTSSITGGSIGQPEPVYSLNAPLYDATGGGDPAVPNRKPATTFTQEVRLSGTQNRFRWVLGGFYAHLTRDYGQDLPVAGFTAISGIPSRSPSDTFAPPDSLFFSSLSYKLDQFAVFGEGTVALSDQWDVIAGLRYYHFSEDKQQFFGGIFGEGPNGEVVSQPGNTTADGVAPRFILSYKIADTTKINAQVSKGFRLGGINDPLNFSLCTPQDRDTFGGHTNWNDETVWNYELGAKSKFFGGKASVDVSVFYMDIHDLQATVTAGTCSSRVIFNVPKARSMGVDFEFEAAPTRNFDFALSGSYDDAKSQSTLTSTAPDGTVSIVSGIRSGARLPSVPKFKFAAAATYQWEVRAGYLVYVTAIDQFVGSRYTQFGDEDLGTLPIPAFGANTPGAPYTASVFTYNPKMPAYNIVNARIGVKQEKWDFSLYGNNLTDEHAFLALDRERGTLARIGYLTNQPRTFGTTLRVNY
ncbi:MAG TPA: TonB-dependent receptor [Myxococcales bacterium]|nr:TonB-dependent receptor [Myxococcales bacterium]